MASQKDPREIRRIIQKAEYEDWSMAMTADLLGHSIPCTTSLCFSVNGGPPMTCTCGAGIVEPAEKK